VQNPFVRFKRYRVNAAHPVENHATESLAACLAFSENIRREFVRFLFRDKTPFDDGVAFDVLTQQQLGSYGIIDLILESPGRVNIVIEVKVRAKEDGSQVREYRNWLEETKTGKKFIFTLVKNADPNFDVRKFGGDDRRTWRELYDFFRPEAEKRLTETTERAIVDHFLGYMEAEGIVTTWTADQILNYGPGVLAEQALTALFRRVREALLAREACPFVEPVILFRQGEWPRLEIGMKSWKEIFGTAGYLNKVYMYYETKAAWGGKAERFYFEFVLWHKQHRNDWALTKSKLPSWLDTLRKNNWEHWIVLKGARELEQDPGKYKFPEAPSYIGAWNPKIGWIFGSDLKNISTSDLVDLCVERIDQYCAVVSALS
jgi:hypothetical protein